MTVQCDICGGIVCPCNRFVSKLSEHLCYLGIENNKESIRKICLPHYSTLKRPVLSYRFLYTTPD